MEALSISTAVDMASARCIAIKVGSALLVDAETGVLQAQWLDGLAIDVAALRARGQNVILISSGAIALGRRILDLAEGELSLEQSQAAAAVGQTALVRAWQDALSRHQIIAAQVLLTLEDTQNRRRYLNGRATLAALVALGTVPIVNENDTVATDEIRYGDNDRLAARVALMAGADLLILLSDVDGLYSADPRMDPNAQHIPLVREITPMLEAVAGGSGTAGSKGGMRTKLLAAKTSMQGGCAMVVTKGDTHRPLRALEHGARATWFTPTTETAAARKQWIAGMKPVGNLIVDGGAAKALGAGNSLLPAGLKSVEGAFQRGDPVSICDLDGRTLGAALAGYGADEARAIAGVRSDRIASILGYPGRAALVHRDDMVIWGTV